MVIGQSPGPFRQVGKKLNREGWQGEVGPCLDRGVNRFSYDYGIVWVLEGGHFQ